MTTRRRTKPADPACKGLLKWLKLNGLSLGALTGTDTKALDAAVHILELHCYGGNGSELDAFRLVVLHMQPSTRHLAYHATAHLMDWHNREEIWERAGLPEIPQARLGRCRGDRSAWTREEWDRMADEKGV